MKVMQSTLQIVFRPAHFFKTFPPEVRKINGDQVWQRDMVYKFNRRQIPPIFCPFASFQLNASVAQFIFMRMLISLFRLIYSSIILDASAQQIEASIPGEMHQFKDTLLCIISQRCKSLTERTNNVCKYSWLHFSPSLVWLPGAVCSGHYLNEYST